MRKTSVYLPLPHLTPSLLVTPSPLTLWWSSSEVNSGFFYKSADEREKLVAAERKFIDDRVMKIIELKNKVSNLLTFITSLVIFQLFQVCSSNDKGFVVINQKVCGGFPTQVAG